MSSIIRAAAAMFVATLLFVAGPSHAQVYEPEDGDAVVVYINEFRAADFDRAKQIMVEAFGEAMSASGQTRRTYWIANPETHEIVGISFFQKGHSVDEWHDHDARQKVLDQLEPLRSAPLTQKHYEVIGSHNARD
jgi:hypothetical protein